MCHSHSLELHLYLCRRHMGLCIPLGPAPALTASKMIAFGRASS